MREELAAIGRDLLVGARQFKRSPALTAGIILSLGFGSGASGTVFSWMEGTVLRPLPAVRDVDRLITVRPELRNGFALRHYPEHDSSLSLTHLARWAHRAAGRTAAVGSARKSEFGAKPAAGGGPTMRTLSLGGER